MVREGDGGRESGDGDTAVVASENGEISIACDDSSTLSGAEALTSSLILQRRFWLLQTQGGKIDGTPQYSRYVSGHSAQGYDYFAK